MLEQRIDDRALIRLIEKWLRAGILDTDGKVLHPVTGTPQGGIVSPILANVYLHYALDLWFHQVVRKHCRGEACLIRYADDFVCAFQYQKDAERFYEALGKRLGKFGLQVATEKTRIIPFHRKPPSGRPHFQFLGFEFYWGKDRSGKPHLKRRTSRKKLKSAIKRFTEWCVKNRDLKPRVLFRRLNAKLRGYYNYYGVYGNYDSLKQFFEQVILILFKWLNRRSQRRSYNWEGFDQLLKHYRIERPRIRRRNRTRQLQLI